MVFDIALFVNGIPDIEMELHSPSHWGGQAQHPPLNPLHVESDLSLNPLTSGLEWKVDQQEVSLTWHFDWLEQTTKSWKHAKTNLTITENNNSDFFVFYNSFAKQGFSLIIDLPEGGVMPGTNNVLVDGQPQHIHVSSAKVYTFDTSQKC